MNSKQLNQEDFNLIKESLKHYKEKISNYDKYPSYEFKQSQLRRVEELEEKLRS